MALSSIVQKRLFILGSFIVLLLAVLLYLRINALVKSFAQIDHTNQVETRLEYVLSYLKDAETGQRGYLLVRDSSFLEPYRDARRRVDSVLQKMPDLVKDDLRQEENLAALRFLIDQQFSILKKTMVSTDTSQVMLALNIGRGKASMDRIREHINRMKVLELGELKKRENEKERYIKLTPLSLLFLVFAMLSIIGFSYYGLTRQLRQTRKNAANLDYLNNELLLKNKQLENSVEELNSFNYIASHDLKEPLRKILFFTDTITGMDYKPPADVMRYLEKIHTSGTRMKALLDDLLIYAQASMTERNREQVDMNVVLAAVVEGLSEVLKEKNGTVSYNNLPQLQAVPSQMQQLFENLISNAVKYSRPDHPPVVTLKSSIIPKQALPGALEGAYERYYQILVSDNGIGFTQDNAEKIFVLFQRLHQRHEFSGTGIGLTICRKIVQNHDGFIMAESQVNQGTTFFIYLPV